LPPQSEEVGSFEPMENSPPRIQTMPSGAAPGGLAAFATVSPNPAGSGPDADAAFAGSIVFTTQMPAQMAMPIIARRLQDVLVGEAGANLFFDFPAIG